MDVGEKLAGVFKEIMHLPDSDVVCEAKYRENGWDSTTHMFLVSKVEETFGIIMETEDVFEFKTFKEGVAIVEKLLK